MKKKEFEFKLESPIIYQIAPAGEKEADLLLLKGPTQMHKDALDDLRKELIGGIMKNSYQYGADGEQKQQKKQQKAGENDDALDKDNVLFFLYSPSFDLKKYKEVFWDLVLDGLCLVDKKVPLTRTLLNDIDADDEIEIIGEYSANFIIPRWLRRQLSK